MSLIHSAYSHFKFWSLDIHLQNQQNFDALAIVLSDHISREAFQMPSLQECLDALADLRARAAEPLAVVGRFTRALFSTAPPHFALRIDVSHCGFHHPHS